MAHNGSVYDIERSISDQPAEVRRAVRQEQSKPKIEAFRTWAEQQLARIPGKSDLARAFRYGLSRWPSFCLFLEDGRVAIDNNPAERALRPIGIGRKNWLFAGADTGAERRTRLMPRAIREAVSMRVPRDDGHPFQLIVGSDSTR